MAPSSAMVSVGIKSWRTVSHDKVGSSMPGRLCGMPPKRVPMVSTGMCMKLATAVSETKATTGAGMRANERTVFPSARRSTSRLCRTNSTGHRNSPPRQAIVSPSA